MSMYGVPPPVITASRSPSRKSPWTQESTGIVATMAASFGGYARTTETWLRYVASSHPTE